MIYAYTNFVSTCPYFSGEREVTRVEVSLAFSKEKRKEKRRLMYSNLYNGEIIYLKWMIVRIDISLYQFQQRILRVDISSIKQTWKSWQKLIL